MERYREKWRKSMIEQGAVFYKLVDDRPENDGDILGIMATNCFPMVQWWFVDPEPQQEVDLETMTVLREWKLVDHLALRQEEITAEEFDTLLAFNRDNLYIK